MSELNNEASTKSKFSPQNLLFLLLVLQFVIAPFYYQPNFGGEGLYLPYNSSVWIVAVWIIATGAFLISRSRTVVLPRYWLGLACLPLGALITGFIVETINPTEWLTRLSVITGGYLFFLALFQFRLTSKQIDQSLYIILAFGMIAAAYGVFQIVFTTNIYPFIPRSPNNIPVGVFQQVNLQASSMATLLVLVYYLISRPTLNTSLLIKTSLCITVFLASYIIAASGSRVGLLGAILGLTILIIGRWRLLTRKKNLFISILVLTIAGATTQTSGLLKSTVKFDRAMGGMEADIRWKVYKISWDLFIESPVTGHGLGSFQKVFQEKRRAYQQQGSLHMGNHPRFSHPHNEIIFWLVEGGIIAMCGIILAATVTFIQLIRVGWQRGSGYAALLIPITLHTQVELPFYISNTHWLLLLFLLFVTHQHSKQNLQITSLSVSANRLIPVSFIGIAFATSWTLIQAQIANSDLVKYYASKTTQYELLDKPLSSLYFRDHALFLSLRQKMIEGIKEKKPEPVVEFINFTENLIQKVPAINYYIELVNAYNIIGQTELRDRLLKEALDTYEGNRRLSMLKQKFQPQKNTNP
ncbi:MAG: Wzy polymerase domain-containing protein [Neptuniibacter sp.]